MTNIPLFPTTCAICGPGASSSELYPPRFQNESFSPEKFSARRTPDRTHFRIVRCDHCGLLRSDPITDFEHLATLYKQSSFDYQAEVESIKRTYGRYLRKLDSLGGSKGRLLEIGCGNGFFLEEALQQGYEDVLGFEPSALAREKASPHFRASIRSDMFRPGLFSESRFDVICFFQVLDHLPHPAEILAECSRILRPGGAVLVLNHNCEAFSAHLLRERSPIVDIEHTFLYSISTLSKLLRKCGFSIAQTGTVFNLYPISYLVRLFPFPPHIKNFLLSGMKALGIDSLPILAPLGNLFVIGQKPQGTSP